jgi:hypothetical protein
VSTDHPGTPPAPRKPPIWGAAKPQPIKPLQAAAPQSPPPQPSPEAPVSAGNGAAKPPTALDVAISYCRRGYAPIPVKGKKPIGEEWQNLRITVETAPNHFNSSPCNVGILLGAASNGLTDVDLDCPEAILIAPCVLPPTPAIFGRKSKRASHRLYVTDLAATHDQAEIKLNDPRTKGTLLELRIGGGGKGAQTVFPGSIHIDGELITWEEDREPAKVDGDELERKFRLVGALALLARYWPPKPKPKEGGGRHDAALVVGGFLSRAGHRRSLLREYVGAIAQAAGDEEWRDRRKAAEDAAVAHGAGQHTFGFPALVETFGRDIAENIAKWIDYRGDDEPREQPRTGPKKAPSANAQLKSARASSFEMTAIQWFWPDRFAIGKLGIIVGLPDEGKGQLLCDIAARATRGLEFPCGEGVALRGNVILGSAEDTPNDTVVPRLKAAGADLERVEIVSTVRDDNTDRTFSLVTDLALLRQKIAEVGDVRLVLIDPISAYLGVGKIDSFRTTDVRAVLAPVVDLAAELNVAIVGIMHFNKKIDVTNVLLRMSDSLAFGATARHVFAVIDDPENKRKLFVKGKNNLARSDIKSLAYEFELLKVGYDRKADKEIWAPHILWQPQPVDVTASEAMMAASANKAPAARDEAKKFLESLLAMGPMPQTEIEAAAKGNGIAWRTVERAKSDLGLVAKKDVPVSEEHPKGGWTWRLPPQRRGWSGND